MGTAAAINPNAKLPADIQPPLHMGSHHPQRKRVLFVTSEFSDLIKCGGLGDVSAALPRALAPQHDIRLLIPGYRQVVESGWPIRIVGHVRGLAALPPCRIGRMDLADGLIVYVLLNPVLYERDGTPYQNLWIISRGPTSHGCTRLASGHMSELRQLAPSASKTLEAVATHRNLPECYDVFDVDGDGTPAVMGVQYYLAFRSDGHTPVKAYVANRREPYYRWLYGDNAVLGAVGQVRIKEVPVCRFAGRKAFGRRLER